VNFFDIQRCVSDVRVLCHAILCVTVVTIWISDFRSRSYLWANSWCFIVWYRTFSYDKNCYIL